MASRKRFIDAELFQDEWFIDLEPKYKLAWIYLMTNCGHDGIWKVSQKLLSFNVGENVEIVGLKRALGDRIVELEGGRLWFIPKFITFQYGNNLSRKNSVLKQFFEMDDKYDLQRYLEVEAPTEPLPGGATVKDKDKDKDKVKDKDEIKDKEGFAVDECFEEIWALYPNKIGRKQAYKHFKASVRSDKDFENIHIALKNYIKSDRVGGGFIQNGSTWFNNWQDWVYPTQSMLTGKNGYSKTRSAASEFVEEMTNAKF